MMVRCIHTCEVLGSVAEYGGSWYHCCGKEKLPWIGALVKVCREEVERGRERQVDRCQRPRLVRGAGGRVQKLAWGNASSFTLGHY